MRKRLLSALSITMAFICVLLPLVTPAGAAYYNQYQTITGVANTLGCTSMQGIAVGSTYLYTAKIRTDNKKAVLHKINKKTGEKVLLKDTSTGKSYVTYLGHANDMDVQILDGKSNLFIVTMKEGSYAMVQIKVSGSKFTKVGNFSVKYNGEHLVPTGVNIIKKTDTAITFLFKKGRSFYEGTLEIGKKSGTINVTRKFKINLTKAVINGKTVDISSYTHQGFGYHKNYIFVPFTHKNISVVLVYYIKGASGTIYTCSDLSFKITSKTYANHFEIESCGISPNDGKLYFNTNRRKVEGGPSFDAVHYFKGYTFG